MVMVSAKGGQVPGLPIFVESFVLDKSETSAYTYGSNCHLLSWLGSALVEHYTA